jgi:hypothetical protein
LSAATLDVSLGRRTTEAIAAILSGRGIPFVFFYSGQSLPTDMAARWPECPVIVKPADRRTIVSTIVTLLRMNKLSVSD